MPIHLTVKQFQKEYSRHITYISESSVYRWIEEDKQGIKSMKNPGGWGIVIIVDEADALFPFLVRNPRYSIRK